MNDLELRVKELELIVDNLLVQNSFAIAKHGALFQMTLGVYHETMEPKQYQSIVSKFISLWEQSCLDSLDELSEVVYDPSILERQRQVVKTNIEMLRNTFLR